MTGLSTLCYIEKDGKYLMLHRTVKKKDVNKDKWIGVGGHFEADESPEECVLREVKEETGYTLTSYRYRGIVTFVSGNGVTEYMSLFTADGFEGTPIPCDEGELEWVDIDEVWKLNIWEGDKIFFRLLDEREDFFSLKLVYDGHDRLVSAALDGQPMELFDILNPDGSKSGIVRERGVAHREGSLHGTVHMWIVRPNEAGGPLPAAVREMEEELGLRVRPEELTFIGVHRGAFEAEFYGRMFRDNELSYVYLYTGPADVADLKLQEEEVESVLWMDYEECRQQVEAGTLANCIYLDEFRMVGEALEKQSSGQENGRKKGE